MAPPTHDTLVIIPAWNEADVLGGVLQEVLDTVGSLADLVVVSDGSTDATADIARSSSAQRRRLVISPGACWPSASSWTVYLYPWRWAYR